MVPRTATSPGRLGDDLVRGEHERDRGRLSIVVARTHIEDGKVEIQLPPMQGLKAARGDRLLVKHAYRLEEGLANREEYRVLLRAKLGLHEPAPAYARVHDHFSHSDLAGCLQQEFRLDAPGLHEITFHVGAEYALMGKMDGAIRAIDQRGAEGALLVDVA